MNGTAALEGQSVVVVLSWYGREDTIACVDSLLADETTRQVLVVDNGSYDGVLEAVADRWPLVHLLQTGTNLGFAGGMNRGVQWALDRGVSFVTVLNNDTIVPAGVLDRLEEAAGRSRAVTPEVYYLDQPDRLWFGGGAVDGSSGLPHHVAPTDLERPVGGLRATDTLAGCCVTASAEVWRRVGLFDARYFLNFEDSDWSLRARGVGVELAVLTGVRILHKVSASFVRSAGSAGSYYYARNGLLFSKSHGFPVMARWRFLRRHVLPSISTDVRALELRAAARSTGIVAVSLGHYLVGRFGRAPGWLENRMSRKPTPARDR